MAEALRDKLGPRKKSKVLRWIVVLVILGVVGAAGVLLWRYFNTYESTDDAQIDGHINAISARIAGNVIQIDAEDEQYVKEGDVLVKLDPRDYEVALAKAQADLADAEAALESSRIGVPVTATNTASTLTSARSSKADASAFVAGAQKQFTAAQARLESTQADVREAEANLQKADDDVRRYKLLVDKNEIPARRTIPPCRRQPQQKLPSNRARRRCARRRTTSRWRRPQWIRPTSASRKPMRRSNPP